MGVAGELLLRLVSRHIRGFGTPDLLLTLCAADILGNGTDSDGCTDRSETGADGADLGWGRPRGCDESEVATCYDRAVTGVTPVITTVWQKEASPRADAGWSDVRVTCLRANRIQSGSRTPEGVPSLGVKVNIGALVHRLSLTAGMVVAGMLV